MSNITIDTSSLTFKFLPYQLSQLMNLERINQQSHSGYRGEKKNL